MCTHSIHNQYNQRYPITISVSLCNYLMADNIFLLNAINGMQYLLQKIALCSLYQHFITLIALSRFAVKFDVRYRRWRYNSCNNLAKYWSQLIWLSLDFPTDWSWNSIYSVSIQREYLWSNGLIHYFAVLLHVVYNLIGW